jgi:hypothetical protein
MHKGNQSLGTVAIELWKHPEDRALSTFRENSKYQWRYNVSYKVSERLG